MGEPNEGPADVTGVFSALTAGFGLSRSQQKLVMRIMWVLLVSTHITWAWGLLTVLGMSAGFAKADDVKELRQTLAASARVTLSQEIRAQVRVRCQSSDQAVRDALTRYIDSLQNEYERIAGGRFTEPQCEVVTR